MQIDDVRKELDLLFPGESNDDKLIEWSGLIDYGLIRPAEDLLRRWRQESLDAAERLAKTPRNYTELTNASGPTGIKISGFADIGRIQVGSDSIAVEAVEYVDADLMLATYVAKIALSKDGRDYYSNISYDEIPKVLIAIEAFKKVGRSVTQFDGLQADWAGDGNFSISVFSSSDGLIRGTFNSNGTVIYLNSLETFDEFESLLLKAKAYIDSHLQPVGRVDFVLRAEAIKRETEFLSVLPGLVIEKTTSYLPVLARKYLQLTYVDEYGTREYGSFHSEVDRFIGKFISGLAEDHQRIAHAAIVSTVEEFAIELERNDAGVFNPDMSPLDYERHYANAFSRAGWSTTMTPNTADQGADVVLSYKDLRGVVQCKLYGQPVGNSAVQEVIAAREYYRAPIAIVVSNAPYTTSARQLAATANVDLLHHDEIALHSQKLGVESDSVEHSTAPQ